VIVGLFYNSKKYLEKMRRVMYYNEKKTGLSENAVRFQIIFNMIATINFKINA